MFYYVGVKRKPVEVDSPIYRAKDGPFPAKFSTKIAQVKIKVKKLTNISL